MTMDRHPSSHSTRALDRRTPSIGHLLELAGRPALLFELCFVVRAGMSSPPTRLGSPARTFLSSTRSPRARPRRSRCVSCASGDRRDSNSHAQMQSTRVTTWRGKPYPPLTPWSRRELNPSQNPCQGFSPPWYMRPQEPRSNTTEVVPTGAWRELVSVQPPLGMTELPTNLPRGSGKSGSPRGASSRWDSNPRSLGP